jgi:hypothetical protein
MERRLLMAKATLDLADGTRVIIEGSDEEVAALIDRLTTSPTARHQPPTPEGRTKSGKRGTVRPAGLPMGRGPTRYVLELRDEGFFSTKRTLGELRTKLEEGGHIYPLTSLSPVVTRLVRKRELRRIKEDRKWKYVNV